MGKRIRGRTVYLAVTAGVAALFLSIIVGGPEAFAQAGDTPRAATWVTDNSVFAIETTPTTIYIAGRFTQVGPSTSSPDSATIRCGYSTSMAATTIRPFTTTTSR